MMPMYLRPYIDFSPQAPYDSATAWSSSDSSGNQAVLVVGALAGLSGLMPSTAVSPMSPSTSRRPHDWVVQPGCRPSGRSTRAPCVLEVGQGDGVLVLVGELEGGCRFACGDHADPTGATVGPAAGLRRSRRPGTRSCGCRRSQWVVSRR